MRNPEQQRNSNFENFYKSINQPVDANTPIWERFVRSLKRPFAEDFDPTYNPKSQIALQKAIESYEAFNTQGSAYDDGKYSMGYIHSNDTDIQQAKCERLKDFFSKSEGIKGTFGHFLKNVEISEDNISTFIKYAKYIKLHSDFLKDNQFQNSEDTIYFQVQSFIFQEFFNKVYDSLNKQLKSGRLSKSFKQEIDDLLKILADVILDSPGLLCNFIEQHDNLRGQFESLLSYNKNEYKKFQVNKILNIESIVGSLNSNENVEGVKFIYANSKLFNRGLPTSIKFDPARKLRIESLATKVGNEVKNLIFEHQQISEIAISTEMSDKGKFAISGFTIPIDSGLKIINKDTKQIESHSGYENMYFEVSPIGSIKNVKLSKTEDVEKALLNYLRQNILTLIQNVSADKSNVIFHEIRNIVSKYGNKFVIKNDSLIYDEDSLNIHIPNIPPVVLTFLEQAIESETWEDLQQKLSGPKVDQKPKYTIEQTWDEVFNVEPSKMVLDKILLSNESLKTIAKGVILNLNNTLQEQVIIQLKSIYDFYISDHVDGRLLVSNDDSSKMVTVCLYLEDKFIVSIFPVEEYKKIKDDKQIAVELPDFWETIKKSSPSKFVKFEEIVANSIEQLGVIPSSELEDGNDESSQQKHKFSEQDFEKFRTSRSIEDIKKDFYKKLTEQFNDLTENECESIFTFLTQEGYKNGFIADYYGIISALEKILKSLGSEFLTDEIIYKDLSGYKSAPGSLSEIKVFDNKIYVKRLTPQKVGFFLGKDRVNLDNATLYQYLLVILIKTLYPNIGEYLPQLYLPINFSNNSDSITRSLAEFFDRSVVISANYEKYPESNDEYYKKFGQMVFEIEHIAYVLGLKKRDKPYNESFRDENGNMIEIDWNIVSSSTEYNQDSIHSFLTAHSSLLTNLISKKVISPYLKFNADMDENAIQSIKDFVVNINKVNDVRSKSVLVFIILALEDKEETKYLRKALYNCIVSGDITKCAELLNSINDEIEVLITEKLKLKVITQVETEEPKYESQASAEEIVDEDYSNIPEVFINDFKLLPDKAQRLVFEVLKYNKYYIRYKTIKPSQLNLVGPEFSSDVYNKFIDLVEYFLEAGFRPLGGYSPVLYFAYLHGDIKNLKKNVEAVSELFSYLKNTLNTIPEIRSIENYKIETFLDLNLEIPDIDFDKIEINIQDFENHRNQLLNSLDDDLITLEDDDNKDKLKRFEGRDFRYYMWYSDLGYYDIYSELFDFKPWSPYKVVKEKFTITDPASRLDLLKKFQNDLVSADRWINNSSSKYEPIKSLQGYINQEIEKLTVTNPNDGNVIDERVPQQNSGSEPETNEPQINLDSEQYSNDDNASREIEAKSDVNFTPQQTVNEPQTNFDAEQYKIVRTFENIKDEFYQKFIEKFSNINKEEFNSIFEFLTKEKSDYDYTTIISGFQKILSLVDQDLLIDDSIYSTVTRTAKYNGKVYTKLDNLLEENTHSLSFKGSEYRINQQVLYEYLFTSIIKTLYPDIGKYLSPILIPKNITSNSDDKLSGVLDFFQSSIVITKEIGLNINLSDYNLASFGKMIFNVEQIKYKLGLEKSSDKYQNLKLNNKSFFEDNWRNSARVDTRFSKSKLEDILPLESALAKYLIEEDIIDRQTMKFKEKIGRVFDFKIKSIEEAINLDDDLESKSVMLFVLLALEDNASTISLRESLYNCIVSGDTKKLTKLLNGLTEVKIKASEKSTITINTKVNNLDNTQEHEKESISQETVEQKSSEPEFQNSDDAEEERSAN